jgi:serine/threonine protein kinase
MLVNAGAQLGPYELLASLGAGGFGEVYKARDTRLDRTVAIKILRSTDPELTARFEREAKAIAALQHPHICALFDVGRQGSIDYLVLEYLEGETVAQRLERGPLKVDDAFRVAIAIADALDKAHRADIVHRDLKPANVMLTKAGAGAAGASQPKLLDFGLAKLRPAAPVANVSVAATVSSPLTAQGAILGTLHYMSPEQLEGQDADARSDIFAFGALVYEMLTGKKAFDGKSPASVIGAILKDNPLRQSLRSSLASHRLALDRVVHAYVSRRTRMIAGSPHAICCESCSGLRLRRNPMPHRWPPARRDRRSDPGGRRRSPRCLRQRHWALPPSPSICCGPVTTHRRSDSCLRHRRALDSVQPRPAVMCLRWPCRRTAGG